MTSGVIRNRKCDMDLKEYYCAVQQLVWQRIIARWDLSLLKMTRLNPVWGEFIAAMLRCIVETWKWQWDALISSVRVSGFLHPGILVLVRWLQTDARIRKVIKHRETHNSSAGLGSRRLLYSCRFNFINILNYLFINFKTLVYNVQSPSVETEFEKMATS